MGLGAGHILDMINRSKQNRAQRPSQRRKFKDYRKDGIVTVNIKNPKFKTVSERELKSIKNRIKTSAKEEQQTLMIRRILVFFTIIIVFVLLYKYL